MSKSIKKGNTKSNMNRSQAKMGMGKSKKWKKGKDPTLDMTVVNPNAAAIDIGGAEHWVAVRPQTGKESVKKFGCVTEELKALADWLELNGVETVVMEATGNYWVSLFEVLEKRGLAPIVVNARYAKNMSGKKGDIPDCQWMQKLHTFGLFPNSFRPVEPIRVLRAYVRQRDTLIKSSAQAIQHMQKALVEMNIQLSNAISDISGETGLRIIDAIIEGKREPYELARLKDGRIRVGLDQLAKSLEGYWKDEQLFILEQARSSFAHYQSLIATCEEKIFGQLEVLKNATQCHSKNSTQESGQRRSKSKKLRLSEELKSVVGVDLTKIDSIGVHTAQVIISEIGMDMSPWPDSKHFCSWLGLCPDHRISGGKILKRTTRPVVSHLRNALRMSAVSLNHSRSWLGAKFRRLRSRLGGIKAVTAMAHQLARLIYDMIKFGEEYVDKGAEAYEKRYQAQRLRWLQKEAKSLNMQLIAT